jgi:thiol-disulfide isomerase/thioredoxin
MSRTESTMLELGTVAPPFELMDVISGRAMGRDDVVAGVNGKSRGLLVMFVCPHCPYVKHVEEELGRVGRDYFEGDGKIAACAVMSNDLVEYPQDGPEAMRKQAARHGWNFPYLLDELQEVAKEYQAACTPDFFLFDAEMKLVYRGQLDASRPRRGDYGNDEPVTGSDLRAAMDAVVAGKPVEAEQRSSIGCNIKWKS